MHTTLENLAGNPALLPSHIDALLDLAGPEVTVRVAMNPGVPAHLIRQLYEAEQGRWREHVLTNASIPIDLLVDQVLAGRHGLTRTCRPMPWT